MKNSLGVILLFAVALLTSFVSLTTKEVAAQDFEINQSIFQSNLGGCFFFGVCINFAGNFAAGGDSVVGQGTQNMLQLNDCGLTDTILCTNFGIDLMDISATDQGVVEADSQQFLEQGSGCNGVIEPSANVFCEQCRTESIGVTSSRPS